MKTLKYVLRIWRTLTVPDWIITPFDIEIENANIEFSVQDEPVEINSNVNITTKYPKLSAAVQSFLLAFPSSYLVEAGADIQIEERIIDRKGEMNLIENETMFWYSECPELQRTDLVCYKNCRLLRNGNLLNDDLWIQNGLVVDPQKHFYNDKTEAKYVFDCENLILAPGFIDIQINGGYGINLSGNCEDMALQLNRLAKALLANGVTAFCPTLVSCAPSFYQKVIEAYRMNVFEINDAAAILGLHLEGPFINKEKRGAHLSEYLMDGFPEGIKSFENVFGTDLRNVRIVTIAPELPNSMEVIKWLTNLGIKVSLGHSEASLACSLEAIRAGATGITHLFNAMKAVTDPGLLGVLASNEKNRVFYGFIADGVHSDPVALRIAHQVHPTGLMLITDAVSAMGLPDGEHQLGDSKLTVKGHRAVITGTQTLAGSVISLDSCVRRMKQFTCCEAHTALNCATLHPSQFLGISDQMGSLVYNSIADFILLDDDLKIKATYIKGKKVWQSV
ncbi:putative N-acetylglucosamine-6-phosphate deacetylase [Trichinella patagoniensis]|uniref:N-acetylglucosamine-6-phosphate deacetylase n=2 Tax=Trichinella TaxID=6333 RepID=A0A0V0Z7Q7_9BILA|nr:putative N-acetylglucosamine-6-phosphate deacetylase [Trichinella patagoniensis]